MLRPPRQKPQVHENTHIIDNPPPHTLHLLNLLIQHPEEFLLALWRVNTESEGEKERRRGGWERKLDVGEEEEEEEEEEYKKYIMRIFHYTPHTQRKHTRTHNPACSVRNPWLWGWGGI